MNTCKGKNSPFTPLSDEPEPENTTCPAIGYQSFSICAPVEVRPFAIAGEARTSCCEQPVIKPGRDVCPGEINGACYFTISQTICVEVPVEFGAETIVGDASVECLGASEENLCADYE
jgi:hypothetical protein